ncbi:hypothetical protein P280DRAFT_521577 [Massarina eburnea CBS 473.64]|uniref:BZIP domain-containing protein n=1 Tax=Massarina eburnea CBS 473.64 TaxID=1395130 RepID=A0A6A6RNW5_9PLEO|nr:hypothetical protein P280DRAFT_521577 [Massarina eburnea CBS 473.64]
MPDIGAHRGRAVYADVNVVRSEWLRNQRASKRASRPRGFSSTLDRETSGFRRVAPVDPVAQLPVGGHPLTHTFAALAALGPPRWRSHKNSDTVNHNNGCLLALPLSSVASRRHFAFTTSIPISTYQPQPSESSFAESLNYSPASCSSSSLTTTSPFDFTSSTTASQTSTWLSSPAPPASRQQLHSSHTAFARQQSDFVLYDQPAPAPPRPQRAPSAPQFGHLFNAGLHFYANSAPSSTTGLQQQSQPQLQQQRPPVPLFSSTSNTHTQQPNNVAAMAGKAHTSRAYGGLKLTYGTDLNSNNSFDSGASLFAGLQSDMSPWEGPASAFTAINPSVAGSTRTVSPKDVFADPLQSAPPSTTFTNITSPDIDDSPFEMNDSFETSPMFGNESMSVNTDWFPLFTREEVDSFTALRNYTPAASAAPLERSISSTSAGRSSVSSANSPAVLDNPSHRRKSSVTGSPAINASITKARRRKGPLPAISVDPGDKVALKRARNTLAARDSRQRKFDHVSQLEKRNAELEAEVERWKSIALAQGYSEP